MASRSEKLRRRQHRKEKRGKRQGKTSEPLRLPAMGLAVGAGNFKMSEAIVELVQPEWENCKSKDAMEKLLTLGMAAWNAALRQGAERAEFLESLAQTIPAEGRQDFAEIMEWLVDRKEALFPHVRRPMISFELNYRGPGEAHVVVLSGLTA